MWQRWKMLLGVVLFFTLLLPLAPASLAQDASPSAQSNSKAKCAFEDLEIDRFTKVYAAGGYRGRRLGGVIDSSGREATQMDVAVNSPRYDVLLILGSFEPTIWNIAWSRGTKILGVVVSGYHRQVVAGLPPEIPLLISSYENRGPCGYFYVSKLRKAEVETVAKKVFDKEVDTFVYSENGHLTFGEELTLGTKMRSHPTPSPKSFLDDTAPRAGAAGLLDALRAKILRKVTDADLRTIERRFERANREGFARFLKQSEAFSRYVVRKEFRFPAGLFDGNAAVFIVPNGVAWPKGKPGDSTVLALDDSLTCRGPLCPPPDSQ